MPAAAARSPFAAVSLVAVAVLALRVRWQLADPQFWAEDGTIFFAQAARYGVAAVAIPYAGYLHSIPHVMAWAFTAFPVLWAPAIYQYSALVLEGLTCALFALPAFRTLMPSDALRYACCIVFAALPFSDDLIANIANLQWFFSIALLLALLVTPSARTITGRYLLEIATLVAIVLTCAEALLFVPIVIHRIVTWTGKARILACAIFCATCVQAFVTLSHAKTVGSHTPTGGGDSAAALVRLFAYKAVLSDVIGIGGARSIAVAPLAIECAAIVSAAIVFASVVRAYRLPAASAVTAAYLFLAPPVVFVASRGYGFVFRDPHADLFWGGARYTLLSTALLVVGAAAFVAAVLPKNRPMLAPIVFLLAFAPAIGSNFDVGALPDRHWPREAAQIAAYERSPVAPAIRVPINPPGWYIDLPPKGERGEKDAAVRVEMTLRETAMTPGDATARWR